MKAEQKLSAEHRVRARLIRKVSESTAMTDRISLLLPMPTTVSSTPTIADLRTLTEIKLSSYLGSPI